MAKKKINKFIFEAGVSKDSNLYPNAYALLIANKSFIQAQVVAFINYNIANTISPYTGYVYAQEKCIRDVGFFIDAIAHDLRYGGNVKIRQIADYFWIDGRPQIRGDVSPEIAGQTYIRDLINNFIFTNIPATPTYGQTAVAQVTTVSVGESAAATRITGEFAILASVITNGTSSSPSKVSGVSSVRLLGKYTTSDILLITDTSSGEILYNFADPASSIELEYKNGRSSGDNQPLSDVDFKSWWQTTDTITTIYFSKDTSTIVSSDNVQIFIEQEDMQIRPWNFGTDAIERMRVAAPQAMLDADFEYGLQPTKWQQLSLVRSYPSIYEIPGTEIEVLSIITDASTSTGSFGSSKITVTSTGAHNLLVGTPITIRGLDTGVNGYSRAEGSFVVAEVLTTERFNYYSSARVGEVDNESLYTNNIQLRKGDFYTGADISSSPNFSIQSAGSSVDVTTVFESSSGVNRVAFTGTSIPDSGSQITGPGIPPGTSVAGVIGTGTITKSIAEDVTAGQSFLILEDVVNIQQNMAVDNGLGELRLITSIVGNRINLNDTFDVNAIGSEQEYSGLSGALRNSVGVDSAFTVIRAAGAYTVTGRDDSTANGQNFSIGDQIKILGSLVGGVDVTNDVTVIVTGIDSGGTITDFTASGVAASGVETYVNVLGTTIDPMPGIGATFNVIRDLTGYSVEIVTGGTNYSVGNLITIGGNSLGGATPANDIFIEVATVSSGSITSVIVTGTSALAGNITVYPTLTLSEFTISTISQGTTLSSGAISTVEITFSAAHGLIPGTTATVKIDSTPPPVYDATNLSLPSSGTWTGVAWTGSGFIAIRSGSNETAFSTNGTTWTAAGTLPNTNTWSSVAAGAVGSTSYIVAVASNSNTAVWSSNQGLTWNSVTLPTVTTTTWNHVAYHNGVFVAVRAGSTGAARSVDGGQNWTTVTLPSTATWTSVAGGLIGFNDTFVVVASGGTAAAYSTNNGVTWLSATLPSSGTWRDVAFGNSRFVAIASGGTAAAFTNNGITWTTSTLPSTANWESIAYGSNNFFIISTGTEAAITPLGEVGTFTAETLPVSGYNEIAFGGLVGSEVFAAVGTSTNVGRIVLTDANHQLLAGPVVITAVPTPTTLRYPARSLGVISTSRGAIEGSIYVRADSFFTHRPYDGGVQLGTGSPVHGAQAIRQSKKYIRYQSGKGIMYTTGALFAPSYNIASILAAGSTVGSTITVTTDENEHGLQAGGIIEISGVDSFEYNGEYTVTGVVSSKSFTIAAKVVLTDLTAILSADAKFAVKNWHGATVRSGAFDDQNGLFFQFDGIRMAVGRRSSTLQLAGTVAVASDGNAVTGTGTRFLDQLKVGERIVLKGMTHTVTSISSQTVLTINPDYRGVNSLTSAKICKTQDLLVPQEDWNLDPLDGTGPSGYVLDPTKMQMIGMQYSWYAAGFIEYILRGADGKFIFFHRIRNSNINTEAYMRTANLPVRYEVENIGAKTYLKAAMSNSQTTMIVADATWLPTSGTVIIDNELISYSGKSADTLLNCTRAASLSNFNSGQNRSYTAGPAATHSIGQSVILVSCTITPVISHWGSALLTDGLFDEDRGYLFSYAATGLSISTTPYTAFLIRLAPSVSNAIIGDLGERELLNRAQLLLKELSISANAQANADQGGIVIEGILNPQNYPANPSNISWAGLSSLAQGGQPSFAQIASGGSVNWNSSGSITRTATVSADIDTGFVYQVGINGERSSPLSISNTSYATAGPALVGSIITSQNPSGHTGTGAGDYIVLSIGAGDDVNTVGLNFRSTTGATQATQTLSTSSTVKLVFRSYTGFTNRLLFTEASWNALGASVGTIVSPTETKFPAGTAIQSIERKVLGTTAFFEVRFNQTSITSITTGASVTFEFSPPAYAQPGETVFSFIANPGALASLDLSELKELTTTAIGGRGAYPNGPDVLAINVRKIGGTAVTSNVILRWSEAQA
jgi:hypothetical protein